MPGLKITEAIPTIVPITCYFLLNYAYAIEDDYYADDYADIKTCYFLLNYAGVRVHGRVAMKYDTCYFLLNYAYIFGCGVVVW